MLVLQAACRGLRGCLWWGVQGRVFVLVHMLQAIDYTSDSIAKLWLGFGCMKGPALVRALLQLFCTRLHLAARQ